MKKGFAIKRIEELDTVVDFILPLLQEYRLFTLYGDLGAGKTTLVSKLIERTGSRDEVSSPTYAIINEYETDHGEIAHIDLYRLEDKAEALDIGLYDYMDRCICFIEWPQILEDEMDEVVRIELRDAGNGERHITVEIPESNEQF